jgi:hypothetical protein
MATDRQELDRLRWAEMRLRDLAAILIGEADRGSDDHSTRMQLAGQRQAAQAVLDVLDASGPPGDLDAALADLARAQRVLNLLRARQTETAVTAVKP